MWDSKAHCAASLSVCKPPRAFCGAPHAPLVTRAPVACLCAPQSEARRTSGPERDKAATHCCIQLPDGTSCVVLVRAGLSIKEVLSGLCERHGINGAAVDLFLVGGDKVGLLILTALPEGILSRGGPAYGGYSAPWGILPVGILSHGGSSPVGEILPVGAYPVPWGSCPVWIQQLERDLSYWGDIKCCGEDTAHGGN